MCCVQVQRNDKFPKKMYLYRWDEWVSEQQLIKVNEENLQRQADAKKKLDEETTSEDDDEPKPK